MHDAITFSSVSLFLCMQFGPHDVVILKPNKAESNSTPLSQGIVYRVKVSYFVEYT